MKKVAIIMGSDSDLPTVEKAFGVLREYGVPFEAHVFSAHRTPVQAKEFSENARKNGFGVIIAAAGMDEDGSRAHGPVSAPEAAPGVGPAGPAPAGEAPGKPPAAGESAAPEAASPEASAA